MDSDSNVHQVEIIRPIKKQRARRRSDVDHRCNEAVTTLEGGSRARSNNEQEDIVKLIHDRNGRVRAVDTLLACLEAKRTYYDVFSKQMVVEDDYATRVVAAKAIIANDVGEPIKRQQILIHNVDSMDDLEQKLAQSPALCETLTRMLEAAKEKNQEVGRRQ